MKKILEKLKKALNYVNGEKRNIGIIIWLLTLLARSIFPDAMSNELYEILEASSAILAGVGTTHDIAKKGRLKWIAHSITKIRARKK